MIIAIVSFIILLALVVLVHEFGHFWVARRFKIKVEEFGFGFSGQEFGFKFPPKLFKFKKGDVVYSVNPLPLGGFVKIFGEGGEGEGNPESFISRPVWQRFLILFAGVFMNIVLAWVLLTVGAGFGTPAIVDESVVDSVKEIGVMITAVSENSPAGASGLRVGDIVVHMENIIFGNTLEIKTVEELQNFTKANLSQKLKVTVKRGKIIIEKELVPRANPPEGEGAMGVGIALVGIVKAPWYKAPWEGLKDVFRLFYLIARGFYNLFSDIFVSGTIPTDIAGPVGIAALSGQFASLGILYFLNFVAAISVNLAFLNVIPIPALDGGRIFFLLIEKIKGSKVDQKVEHAIHGAFFILLMLLVFFVTYRDLTRFL